MHYFQLYDLLYAFKKCRNVDENNVERTLLCYAFGESRRYSLCLLALFETLNQTCSSFIIQQLNMGQLNLPRNSQTGFETGSWVEAIEDANNTIFVNINPYRNRLLMNKDTAELVEQYELQFISQKDFDSFLAQLELRKQPQHQYNNNVVLNRTDAEFRNSAYIYKIRYFQNLSVKELCSTIFHGRLYIDKVEVRLKELNDIPFYDQLYLYYACLSGFKILYEKVGVFEINEEMIFFDQEGQVKVWMNPNLSSFTPNYEPQDYNNQPVQNQGSQSEMLKNLMNIIQQNTDKQSVGNNVQFKQYLIQKGLFQRLSFSKAIQYFASYCEQHQLQVNNYMSAIYDLFHQDDPLKRSQSETSEVQKVVYNTHFQIGKTNNEQGNKLQPKSHFRSSSQFDSESRNQLGVSQYRQRVARSGNMTPVKQQQQKINSFKFIHQNLQETKQQNGYSALKYDQNNRCSIVTLMQPKITKNFEVPERKSRTQFTYQTNNLLSPTVKNDSEIRYRSTTKPQNDTKITFSYKPPPNSKISNFVEPTYPFSLYPDNIPQPRKQSIIDKLETTVVQREVAKQQESLKMSPKKESRQQRSKGVVKDNSFNFYSASQEYALDKEIADDMIKYLGFNPNI